ncbi:MAG: hypothetical protein K2M41_04235 [Muribaculaceae bacterium]|nr:hypothetical protein [Muribaculaceae bacterium]
MFHRDICFGLITGFAGLAPADAAIDKEASSHEDASLYPKKLLCCHHYVGEDGFEPPKV